MKIVIDASIGFKTILPEDGSDKALKLRDDFKKGIHELLAPDLYDAIYLSLSEQESCPLLTDDQKLIKAAPGFSFLSLDDL